MASTWVYLIRHSIHAYIYIYIYNIISDSHALNVVLSSFRYNSIDEATRATNRIPRRSIFYAILHNVKG